MGLFHKTKKKKRTVGIAEEGSFSGLEVTLNEEPTKISKSKPTRSYRETDTSQTNDRKRFFKFFSSCKQGSAVAENHPTDSSGEESSELLSVYTSCYEPKEDGSLVALQQSGNTTSEPWVVTLDHLSDLILDLEKAVTVGAKRPLRALKMLLALSTNHTKSTCETRMEMVRSENARLVPVLFQFLNRCTVPSKEHTLTLLILGNLSIPQPNKRVSYKLIGARVNCNCVSQKDRF